MLLVNLLSWCYFYPIMNKTRTTIGLLSFTMLLFSITGLQAQDTRKEMVDLVASANLARLEELSYFPPELSEEGRALILAKMNRLKPNLVNEVLFVREYTEDNLPTDLELYQLIHQVSQLQGLEYYSASRKKMRLLFKQAFRVSEKGNKTPLPDLSPETISAGITSFTVFQEDLTFGKNYSRMEVSPLDEGLLIRLTNLSPMRYGPLTLVGPEKLELMLWISLEEGRLTTYGLSAAQTFQLFGLEKSKQDSFYNRLVALYSWISAGLDEL
jgi:hypothetical protein